MFALYNPISISEPGGSGPNILASSAQIGNLAIISANYADRDRSNVIWLTQSNKFRRA
jgi:hypothetical protein